MLDKFKVLRNAETYVVNRQFSRAISEYRSLLETKGEDPALLNTLGDLLLKNKEQAEALSHFRRVAQIFLESGFTNKAIAVCKKVHKLDPSDRETMGQLADLYTKRGFQSQAAKYYRQLVAESRDAGHFQEAANWQKHLLTVFPGEPGAFAEMAELNLELDEANGALGNFVTASWLSFNKGAYQESVEYAEQALSVDEQSEAATRLKEVASCVLVDGDQVLSDPAFQLDDELFSSIVSFKAEESETATREPAKETPEELVTAPRTTEPSEEIGEPAVKPEEDWSKGQDAVDDYSAVGEFDGSAGEEAPALEAEAPDELLTGIEGEDEPEAEKVHELSEDIIDNDLQDVEELLKDVAQVEVDSEQHPEDFGMVEGARLGELDIKVGGTVDGFERYGEVLEGDEIGETPSEPERPEQSEKLSGGQEEARTGIEAADEGLSERSDEGQLDIEAVESAAAEGESDQGTPVEDSVEGLVGTDEHLQEDTLVEAIGETSPEQAPASELDEEESSPVFQEDEQSVSGVVEIPEDIETLEEPLKALVEDDKVSASSVLEEAEEIFEVSVEESADEVLERLEEVPFESEGADLGREVAVGEPREDETVLEIADDFSSEELSSVSVEDLFEEAVSAEDSLESTEASLEHALDLDEIEGIESTEADIGVAFRSHEPFEDEPGVEGEFAEHRTIDGSSEESVLDQELLHKSDDDESQSDREDLEEPKLETVDQEMFKTFQEPPSFWGKLRDTVLGRSDADEEEVADEDASEEVFDAVETVDNAASENIEYARIDDVESGWETAEVVESVDEGVSDEPESGQDELLLEAPEEVEAKSDEETEEVFETEGIDEEASDVDLVALEDGDESVLDNAGEPEEQIDLTGEESEQEKEDTTGEDAWVAKGKEETGYEVALAEEAAPEVVVEAEEAVEAAAEEVVDEEHTHHAESEGDAGEANDEAVVEAAEVVDDVTTETVEDAESDKQEAELKAGEVAEVASDEEATETSESLSGDETEGGSEFVEAAETDLEQGANAEEHGEETEPIELEALEEVGESVPGKTGEPEEAVELVVEEQIEVTANDESAAETEETVTLEAMESEEEVASKPVVDAGEPAEDAPAAGLGEEITFETDLELEPVPAEDSVEEVKLEAAGQEEAEVFQEPHSFWGTLRDAVLGGTSEEDDGEAGANVSEEPIDAREAAEGTEAEVDEEEYTYEAKSEEASDDVDDEVVEAAEALEDAEAEVDEEEYAYQAEAEQEAVEAVHEEGVEEQDSDEEELAVVAEEAEEEVEAVSDEEGEGDLKADEVVDGDSEAIVETVEVDEEEYTREAKSEEASDDVDDEVVEAAEAHEDAEAEVDKEEYAYQAEAEQEAVEAVHEEGVEEQDSDEEELALVAEEAEEEVEVVSDEEGEGDLKADELVDSDSEAIVETDEGDEEEPRYQITDLWNGLVKKARSEDESEDAAEPEEVETIASLEPESEWEASQDLEVEAEAEEERELETQEDVDPDGEPNEVDTLELAQDGDSVVEPQGEEAEHEAPVVDPDFEKSRDYRSAITETWRKPSVYADRYPSRQVQDVTSPAASTTGWQTESDETGNGDRKQDLGSLEEALQEYDFNIKLGLREEAERLISQLLAEHEFDERVLLRAKSHGLSLPSTDPEAEPVEESEKTIEGELDSAFEDIFKMPGDEIPEDVLVFELDTADNAPSDESKVQYDLGLGYREMGLLDDAVEKFEEAFQVAIDTDDRDHAANCCGMLASTYRELTEYRKVVEWADRGLGLHVAKAFEEKALQYERAQALEMLGEFRQSLDTYRALMEQDPAFRDVRARVGRLNLLSN